VRYCVIIEFLEARPGRGLHPASRIFRQHQSMLWCCLKILSRVPPPWYPYLSLSLARAPDSHECWRCWLMDLRSTRAMEALPVSAPRGWGEPAASRRGGCQQAPAVEAAVSAAPRVSLHTLPPSVPAARFKSVPAVTGALACGPCIVVFFLCTLPRRRWCAVTPRHVVAVWQPRRAARRGVRLTHERVRGEGRWELAWGRGRAHDSPLMGPIRAGSWRQGGAGEVTCPPSSIVTTAYNDGVARAVLALHASATPLRALPLHSRNRRRLLSAYCLSRGVRSTRAREPVVAFGVNALASLSRRFLSFPPLSSIASCDLPPSALLVPSRRRAH